MKTARVLLCLAVFCGGARLRLFAQTNSDLALTRRVQLLPAGPVVMLPPDQAQPIPAADQPREYLPYLPSIVPAASADASGSKPRRFRARSSIRPPRPARARMKLPVIRPPLFFLIACSGRGFFSRWACWPFLGIAWLLWKWAGLAAAA